MKEEDLDSFMGLMMKQLDIAPATVKNMSKLVLDTVQVYAQSEIGVGRVPSLDGLVGFLEKLAGLAEHIEHKQHAKD